MNFIFGTGLGLKLFVDTLNLTTPDLIIQIDCANQTLNFPAITTEYLALEPGWLYNTEPVGDPLNSHISLWESVDSFLFLWCKCCI